MAWDKASMTLAECRDIKRYLVEKYGKDSTRIVTIRGKRVVRCYINNSVMETSSWQHWLWWLGYQEASR